MFSEDQAAALNAMIAHLNLIIASLTKKTIALKIAAELHEERIARLEKKIAAVATVIAEEGEEKDDTAAEGGDQN